jgi:hypothetical protein
VQGLVEDAGEKMTPEFVALRIDLVVRWRLQKPRGAVDWSALKEDLKQVLDTTRYREDHVKLYYYGIALWHLREIAQARSVFAKIRTMHASSDVRRSVRNYLVGPEGLPLRVQGVLQVGH